MPLKLRDLLYWCNSGGRAVFLDLKADRYFCLPGEANAAFLRLVSARPDFGDSEKLAPLLQRGLLIEGDVGAAIQPPAELEVPASDYPVNLKAAPRPVDVVRAMVSELRMAWSLRRTPLHQVIERVGRSRPTTKSFGGNERRSVGALVRAASVTALILRRHDRCLVRGLAFHSSCRKRGVNAKLVLGVIAHPFTAHCWVQLGNVVLVGGYEQARLYTPILVLE